MRMLLIWAAMTTLPHARTYAQQGQRSAYPSNQAPEKDGAERVFATAAPKVVFLIARKSGEPHARASGIILSSDGYIATNYHALQGADSIEIRFFPNPTELENYQSFNAAKLLYANADRDVALVKVNAKSLPFLECSIKAKGGCEPRVGQTV